MKTPTIEERIENDYQRITAVRRPLRERTEDDAVSAFLAKGGQIERLPADPALAAEHQWPTPAPLMKARAQP